MTTAEPIDADALRIRHEFLTRPHLQLSAGAAAALFDLPLRSAVHRARVARAGSLSGASQRRSTHPVFCSAGFPAANPLIQPESFSAA
jgi:hypothetical protein